jgi:hypothetical protein
MEHHLHQKPFSKLWAWENFSLKLPLFAFCEGNGCCPVTMILMDSNSDKPQPISRLLVAFLLVASEYGPLEWEENWTRKSRVPKLDTHILVEKQNAVDLALYFIATGILYFFFLDFLDFLFILLFNPSTLL